MGYKHRWALEVEVELVLLLNVKTLGKWILSHSKNPQSEVKLPIDTFLSSRSPV